MRGKCTISGQNWDFDGSTICVRIPMKWKRHGGRKVIIAPDGGDAWAPARPRPDEALIRAVVRAHRWKRVLERGEYRFAAELADADAEGVTRSFVNRLLRLTLLAPDIVEAILDGRQPKGLQLEDLTRALPSVWDEQRQRLLARERAGFSAADTAAHQPNAPSPTRLLACTGRPESDVAESTRLARSGLDTTTRALSLYHRTLKALKRCD